jgi:hypothetical protein
MPGYTLNNIKMIEPVREPDLEWERLKNAPKFQNNSIFMWLVLLLIVFNLSLLFFLFAIVSPGNQPQDVPNFTLTTTWGANLARPFVTQNYVMPVDINIGLVTANAGVFLADIQQSLASIFNIPLDNVVVINVIPAPGGEYVYVYFNLIATDQDTLASYLDTYEHLCTVSTYTILEHSDCDYDTASGLSQGDKAVIAICCVFYLSLLILWLLTGAHCFDGRCDRGCCQGGWIWVYGDPNREANSSCRIKKRHLYTRVKT